MSKDLLKNFPVDKDLACLFPTVLEELSNNKINLNNLKSSGKYLIHDSEGKRDDYIKKLAAALCSKEKFMLYFNSFNDGGKKVILDFAFKPFVLKHRILKEVKGEDSVSNWYRIYDYSDMPMSFAVRYDWVTVLELPPAVKKCLKSHLKEFLEEKEYISQVEFEKTGGYFSEKQGLEFFLNSVQIMQFLNDSGFFQRDPGSNITKGLLSKLQKISAFTPFVKEKDLPPAPGKKAEDWEIFCSYEKKATERLLDARLILPLALISLAVNKINFAGKGKKRIIEMLQQPQDMFREFLKYFSSTDDCRFDEKFLYPHISVPKGYFHEYTETYRAKMFFNFVTVIKSNPPIEATSFDLYLDKISDRGLPHFFDSNKNDNYFRLAVDYDYTYDRKFEISRERLILNRAGIFFEYVDKPAYNNLFLALAAMGLFEITWKLPNERPKNRLESVNWCNNLAMYPYGKIGYIKITPLGSYVFGLTETVKIEGIKSYSPPQLDRESLLVHIEKGDKTMKLFLEPFCIAISSTLYKIDEGRLRKYCKSKEDVMSIFSTLSARSESSLPSVWKKLKDGILSSFVTLNKEIDWVVISLENQSPEFVSCAERLSRAGFCVKMEGKKIAVKQSRLNSLIKKMEAEGFKV